MNKEKFFDMIMNIVSETMDVTIDELLSTNRKMSLVDARCMLVFYAVKLGIPTDYILQRMQRKSHYSIQNLLDVYHQRKASSYFHYLSSQIGNRVESINCQ